MYMCMSQERETVAELTRELDDRIAHVMSSTSKQHSELASQVRAMQLSMSEMPTAASIMTQVETRMDVERTSHKHASTPSVTQEQMFLVTKQLTNMSNTLASHQQQQDALTSQVTMLSGNVTHAPTISAADVSVMKQQLHTLTQHVDDLDASTQRVDDTCTSLRAQLQSKGALSDVKSVMSDVQQMQDEMSMVRASVTDAMQQMKHGQTQVLSLIHI